MIKLYQFASGWGVLNASPFCMKLEVYLRLAKLPYEVVNCNDPRRGPKAKLPFLEDNGKYMGDTTLIIEYLQETYGDALDAGLSESQKAQALALQRLTEEHLYWCITYSRWIDPQGWKIIKQAFFRNMQLPWRWFVPNLVRKKLNKTLYAQGIGHHTAAEIYRLGNNDIWAIAQILGKQSFFMGDNPTSIDATMYGFLASILLVPFESPLKSYAKTQLNLVAYCNRMKEVVGA